MKNQYDELVRVLNPEKDANPFFHDSGDQSRLQVLNEHANFRRAHCLSQIRDSAADGLKNLDASIKAYDQFVENFKDSELAAKALAAKALAAKALAAKGRVLLQMNRLDEASQAFERLGRDYPESEEGTNGLLNLLTAAINVGNLGAVTMAVHRMTLHAQHYRAAMFAAVGQMMVDNNLHDQALQVYGILLTLNVDGALKEEALYGLGRSCHAQEKWSQSIDFFRKLMNENSRTGYFFDATLLIAESLRKNERYDEAIEALREIFRADQDHRRLKMATFELAQVQEAQGRKDAAFASYLRQALTPDPRRIPSLEAMVGECVYRCTKLGLELEEYETVVMMADKFLEWWGIDQRVAEVRKTRGQATFEISKRTGITAVGIESSSRGDESHERN